MEGTLWLAPFVVYVAVRTMNVDRQWKTIAEMALIGYVFICLVALIVRASGV